MDVGPLRMVTPVHSDAEEEEEEPAPWPSALVCNVPAEPRGTRSRHASHASSHPRSRHTSSASAAAGKMSEQVEIKTNGSAPVKQVDGEEEEEVEAWGNKTQFLLACIGLAVGLGNVWRFPYLLHKNGGGAFLIPYIIMLCLEGLPIMYVEMAIGQYFRGGSIVSWEKIHPSLKGLGMCCVIISSFLCIYYVMVIAWVLYYLWVSLRTSPAYGGCDYTDDVCCTHDKTLYYWYAVVLKATPSIDDMGDGPSWELVVLLILAWIVTYLCVFQGVKSTGKAAYFAATFPYICLFILLVRGLTLPGADIGLKALFTPKFDRLLDPRVWIDAATQIFFSLSLGFGALVAFASFMPYKNNITRDTIMVACINCGTSLLAGICVYSILGFREHSTGAKIDNVSAGTGLTFIAITEAVSSMTGTPFFAFVFFFMLFNLGVSSQFGTLAGLVTPLYNDLRVFGKARKEICVAVISLAFLLIGLLFTPGNGEYMLQLFNNYPVTMPLLVVSIVEAFGCGWVFGIDNFDLAIQDMTGAPCPKFFKICIKFVSPAIMIILLIWLMVNSIMEVETYEAFVNCSPDIAMRSNSTAEFTETKPLPTWARVMGGLMVTLCVLPVAVVGITRRMSIKEFMQCLRNERGGEYVIGEAPKNATRLSVVNPEDVKVNYVAQREDVQSV